MYNIYIMYKYNCIIFTFNHLADNFIQSNLQRLTGTKYFMHFENTIILILNVFKYKLHLIENSILYFKYVF